MSRNTKKPAQSARSAHLVPSSSPTSSAGSSAGAGGQLTLLADLMSDSLGSAASPVPASATASTALPAPAPVPASLRRSLSSTNATGQANNVNVDLTNTNTNSQGSLRATSVPAYQEIASWNPLLLEREPSSSLRSGSVRAGTVALRPSSAANNAAGMLI